MEQPELSSELCSTSHGEALHSPKAQANKAAPLALLADSEIAVLKTKRGKVRGGGRDVRHYIQRSQAITA